MTTSLMSSFIAELGGNRLRRRDRAHVASLQSNTEKFHQLVAILNSEYPPAKESQSFTADAVRLLWTLSSGVFSGFEDFERILNGIYPEEGPPISVAVAKELLAITSGNFRNVQSLPYEEDEGENVPMAERYA